MVALETENIALMRSGLRSALAIAQRDQVKAWAERRGLLPDQAEAAEVTLCAPDWITAIEGRAGSAKTTTVGAIKEFAAEQGCLVRGFAPTTRAVKALSEAGLPSRTVAGLLENPIDPARKEIWIIDESSLLATRQVNGLLRKARDAEVDRIVFVGDQRQHHAIEAGRPIHQMHRAGMTVARLETIRRQRDPELRKSVMHASAGELSEALAVLDQRGDIRQVENSSERYRAIAAEYVAAHRAGERVLVVSPANEERRELNAAIRTALKRTGGIAEPEIEQTILVARDLTPAAARARTQLRNWRRDQIHARQQAACACERQLRDRRECGPCTASLDRHNVRRPNRRILSVTPYRGRRVPSRAPRILARRADPIPGARSNAGHRKWRVRQPCGDRLSARDAPHGRRQKGQRGGQATLAHRPRVRIHVAFEPGRDRGPGHRQRRYDPIGTTRKPQAVLCIDQPGAACCVDLHR